MNIFKKIFGTTENEFSIGIGANRIRLINNAKAFELKDKDNIVLTMNKSFVGLGNVTNDAQVKDDFSGYTAKTTPVDADTVIMNDSAASGAVKKLTWANVKATLKTYFDGIYATGTIPTKAAGSDIIAGTDDVKFATAKSLDDASISPAKLQAGSITYAADGGSTDTYAITLSPAITGYTTGMVIRFKANTANTGACTLNVNSKGAKTIKKQKRR